MATWSMRRIGLWVWAFALAPLAIAVLMSATVMSALQLPCCEAASVYRLMQEVGVSVLLVSKALTWPVVTLLGLWIVTGSRAARSLSEIFRRFKSVKIFGSEVTFSEEGARVLSMDAESAFRSYRENVNSEIARLVRVHRVAELLKEVFTNSASHTDVHACRARKGFRCTIHIEDLLFEETLLQLLSYFPRGSGAGRTFSIRYGILGSTWRLKKHQGRADLSTAPENLIQNWGMTDDEARASTGQNHAYLCVLLRHSQTTLPLGVIYMDSEETNAFGSNDQEHLALATRIETDAKAGQLVNALENVVDEVRKYGARIKIHA